MKALLISIGGRVSFYSREIEQRVTVTIDRIFKLQNGGKEIAYRELDLSENINGYWVEISDFTTPTGPLSINRQLRTATEIKTAVLRRN